MYSTDRSISRKARVPPAELFDDYEIDDPEGIGVFCFEENVASRVAHIDKAAAGPDGVDEEIPKLWNII